MFQFLKFQQISLELLRKSFMHFLCTHNQRLPNAIFDFRKIPIVFMKSVITKKE